MTKAEYLLNLIEQDAPEPEDLEAVVSLLREQAVPLTASEITELLSDADTEESEVQQVLDHGVKIGRIKKVEGGYIVPKKEV